jgi:hypothetical protein
MYQLSIEHPGGDVTSDHTDFDHAHRELLGFVIAADYYLHPLSTSTGRACFALLALPDTGRRPHTAGHAAITRRAVSAGDEP